MSDRTGACMGGCVGPGNASEEFTAANGRWHHNSRQIEWPQRDVQTVLGLLEMLMCSVGHPWTWYMFNEPLLCARHWPTLEATKKYLGQTVLREHAFQGGEGTWNGHSGRVISESLNRYMKVQRHSRERKYCEQRCKAGTSMRAPSLNFSWVAPPFCPHRTGEAGWNLGLA